MAKKVVYLSLKAFWSLVEVIPRCQNILEHLQDAGADEEVGSADIGLGGNRMVSCYLLITTFILYLAIYLAIYI